MTDKELKKLNRAELLELLLVQTKELERLREKLDKAESLLSDRYLRILESGSLAEAVLKINGVMDAAQAAADQYLENIRQTEKETKDRCIQLLLEAKREADLVRNGYAECDDPEEFYCQLNEKYQNQVTQ